MKLLSIGNSFSQDAHRYLHACARSAGVELTTYSLYIGGCSLERHWHNFASQAPAYGLGKNGESEDGAMVNIQQALQLEAFDVITLQQVSGLAGQGESYEPFLKNLVQSLRASNPQATLYFQQTWEYEQGSPHPDFPRYGCDCDTMYRAVKEVCTEKADEYGLKLIPSGEVIHRVKAQRAFDVSNGGQSLYRDAFHMHKAYGRYLLSLVWLKTLTGVSVKDLPLIPLDEPAKPELLHTLQESVDTYLS